MSSATCLSVLGNAHMLSCVVIYTQLLSNCRVVSSMKDTQPSIDGSISLFLTCKRIYAQIKKIISMQPNALVRQPHCTTLWYNSIVPTPQGSYHEICLTSWIDGKMSCQIVLYASHEMRVKQGPVRHPKDAARLGWLWLARNCLDSITKGGRKQNSKIHYDSTTDWLHHANAPNDHERRLKEITGMGMD